MKIGIFTYGTRGDLQPYIALALGFQARGHAVSIAASADFEPFVRSFGIDFQALYGHAQQMMQGEEGRRILKSENALALMKYYFGVLHAIRVPLRQSFMEAISKVDCVIANAMTMPIVSAITEKQHKKMALTYFMPPLVPTRAFPVADFDFCNAGWYNLLTYQLAHAIFWKFTKADTNEFRQELGLKPLKQNLIRHIDQQKTLDLYCLSPTLIPQPADWAPQHQITGFLQIPETLVQANPNEQPPEALTQWLQRGQAPIYMGFGSNAIGNPEKMIRIIQGLLEKTQERIVFCSAWSGMDALPKHDRLFTLPFVSHDLLLPHCKLGIFHGGAGTLASMLRHELPSVIISFYTDQPTWGKIVARRHLGVHIPLKKLTLERLIAAIQTADTAKIRREVAITGKLIRSENGLENSLNAIEAYFAQ
ncbi:MAG: glycosyltransferase family 1 protein [Chitinophagales bacterium]|nr:glycosyltransferase family 1 protein [Chitinophagales bacterium]